MTLGAFDRRRLGAMLALLCLVLATLASAVRAEAGFISVENAWVRATPKGAKVAAGYLTIKNDGREPDRLLSASARFAGTAEIHQSSMVNGVMQMRPVTDGIPIAPKSTVTLGPGAYHFMFMELAAPLNEGDTVSGELTFERAGKVEVTFHVLGMGAQGPDENAHHH
jgi:periplasmic copper chaperone A